MVINYFGAEFVKIQFGDTIIAFNPVSKESGLKGAKFGADIVLSTLNHPDMNGVEAVTFGERKPFLINGPGEYEVKGVFIQGLPSKTNYDGEERINTIYTVVLEGMTICFLGAVNTPELPKDTDEAIQDVDILFVPVGGDGVLTPAQAYKLAVSIGPKIMIPIHYGAVGTKDALKQFLKEAGENPAPESRLTLKKKDIEGRDADVVVLAEE